MYTAAHAQPDQLIDEYTAHEQQEPDQLIGLPEADSSTFRIASRPACRYLEFLKIIIEPP
jgi:hypothetical protein